MGIIKNIRFILWPDIEEFIKFLLVNRAKNKHNSSLNIGINYSIIFYSACYLESVLEAGLKAILLHKRLIFQKVDIPDFNKRKTINQFYIELEDDIKDRISRATGIQNYDYLFKLLTGKKISEINEIKSFWEGIQILFQFRNVLAHGREISASMTSTSISLVDKSSLVVESWEEFYCGGYKNAEDYLLKKGLIKKKFVEEYFGNADGVLYFSDNVADHFWELAKDFILQLSKSLPEDVKKVFDEALLIQDNKNNRV